MQQFRWVDFSEDSDPATAYRLCSDLIIPRPIALVSSLSRANIANLAPFSFFMLGGSNPPSVAISPVVGTNGQEKDTLRNVRETEEFVINLVHASIAGGMNEASLSLSSDESEWNLTGFQMVASELVSPPRVAESLVQFECRLHQIVEHGSGPGAARYIIGTILGVHLNEEIDRFRPISRLGGADYLDLEKLAIFSLDRPQPKPLK